MAAKHSFVCLLNHQKLVHSKHKLFVNRLYCKHLLMSRYTTCSSTATHCDRRTQSKRSLSTHFPRLLTRHSNLFTQTMRTNSSTLYSRRYKSTAPPAQVEYIPEPPTPVADAYEQLSGLAEPTLSSLGLCNYTPAGGVQKILECMHIYGDMPWWATLTAFAVAFRIVIIPLQVYTMRASIHYQNHMPTMSKYQEKIARATELKDVQTALLFSGKLQNHMNTHKPSVLKGVGSLFYQVPIFLSVLAGIRGMSSLPVQSMTTGGLYWFPDLTVPDPYFALPILTAATLLANVELGADGMRAKSLPSKTKWITRGMIGLGVPVMMSFSPSALGVYWFTSNIMAVIVINILKIPTIKTRLQIPDYAVKTETKFSKESRKDSVLSTITSTYKEKRIKATISDAESINARAFHEAGRAKIVKTFKYDPTKAVKSS